MKNGKRYLIGEISALAWVLNRVQWIWLYKILHHLPSKVMIMLMAKGEGNKVGLWDFCSERHGLMYPITSDGCETLDHLCKEIFGGFH